ncbi:MAG: hypothetical protein JW829_07750 [Pirellulales bacterium]|nr:hypothetical protein [Pirellulales bacterium]
MYKGFGLSNTDIALYTSWLYLPWAIKPFWSPLVDIVSSKRWWIVAMQLLIGAGLAGVALTIPTTNFFQYTLAFMWLLAFSSATHDIAADGFYMLSLSANNQSWFVGIRSTFYRFAAIAGQGLLVMLAGVLESATGLPDATLEVRAVLASEAIQTFEPQAAGSPDRTGEPRLTVHATTLDISRRPRAEEEVLKTIQAVRRWNIEHGFYSEEKGETTEDTNKKKSSLLEKLESLIRRHFGTKTHLESIAGNIGIVYITLEGSLDADETRVIRFKRTSGDKNIQIKEGERFQVTTANRDVPMAAVVQLDSKLARDISATFSAGSGNSKFAWAASFYLVAGLFLAFCAYHAFTLPHPPNDTTKETIGISYLVKEFLSTFASFFRKKSIVAAIAFLLFFRFAEGQLVKIATLFLLDTRGQGGLALTTSEVGFVYGTVGVLALTIGGILGGFLGARHGLKFWIWWMVLAINLPDIAYVALAIWPPDNIFFVHCAVAIEQFGYGFGFTAYMLYMLYIAQGEHETAHFAICTGFMALSMMLPGMISGWLQDLVGYENFFIWVLIATIPSFLVVACIRIDPAFGKKS